MQEKIFPQNIDAEKGVLGSIIIDPEAMIEIEFLQSAHFYTDSHQIIFGAITSLYQRHEPADMITLCDSLEQAGKLEHVGGMGYITSLINGVPTSGNVTHYARIVERTWIYRQLIQVAGTIADDAYNQREQALEDAEKAIFQIGQGAMTGTVEDHTVVLDDYMTSLMELHERNKNGALTGLPTGFPLLDYKLGGFQKGKVHIVAGRPGDGKTALALNHIDEAVSLGCNVLFFSLEMSKKQLMTRWIAMRAHVNSTHLRDGTLSDEIDASGRTEWERVMDADREIRELPGHLYIDDTPQNNIIDMRSKALRTHAQQNISLIVLDYLQMAETSKDRSARRLDRRLEVEEISKWCKGLARELDVPMIALAQLSRAVESRSDRMPQLSDLKEASGIEQDADVVIFIHKSNEIPKEAIEYDINLVIEKNRDGEQGLVPLHYVGAHTKFYPMRKDG